MQLFENTGPLVILAIIAGIFLVLLLCISLTILVLLLRNRVKNIDLRLESVMSAMQIEENGRSKKKSTAPADKKGLQLDDDDIKKLRNIGVGMD
ncbi:MAG: hypothetical protein JRF72_15025 [Deltaproteobacteria bacterium]|jgi:cell division protein FtsL|nr:hypothetical protein [Deltaproteobacteria bacterium]